MRLPAVGQARRRALLAEASHVSDEAASLIEAVVGEAGSTTAARSIARSGDGCDAFRAAAAGVGGGSCAVPMDIFGASGGAATEVLLFLPMVA